MADYYDPKTLRKLQQIELEILKDFDAICRAHDLEYFIVGGTAIGQLRHGGFIPWDDDIDVSMDRKNYDRFLEIAAREYADKYTILNNDQNPAFPLMNTRWGLKGTTFKTEDMVDIPGDFGIFLDIFCFDNVSDDDRKMKRQVTMAWFWGKLLVLSGVKTPVLYTSGIKAKIIRGIAAFVHTGMKVLHISSRRLYQKAFRYATKYKDVQTRRVNYMFDPRRFACMTERSTFFPTRRALFEGIEVSVMNQADKFLTQRYGDYMQLPPEEQRHNHPPCELDFGIYADL